MTFSNLTELREAVRHLIPGIGPLNIANDRLDTYCGQAVRRLSEDKPREITGSFVATGVHYYDLSVVLSLWIDGFSTISRIVPDAPVMVDGEDISLATPDDYRVYNDGTGEFIRFESPPSTTVIVTYTGAYSVNGLDGATVTTVPTRWINAVEYLTASIMLAVLANQASGVTDSEIVGDIINYRTKQREYLAMAQYWEGRYMQAVGLGKDASNSVGAAIAHRAYTLNEGRRLPRLTH